MSVGSANIISLIIAFSAVLAEIRFGIIEYSNEIGEAIRHLLAHAKRVAIVEISEVSNTDKAVSLYVSARSDFLTWHRQSGCFGMFFSPRSRSGVAALVFHDMSVGAPSDGIRRRNP